MNYAIIALGGKQYRVREGERLLVDRLAVDEGKTFHPDVLLVAADGEARLGEDLKGEQVTVRVAAHVLGEKVIVGKHRRRTGYRRRKGHRSRLSRIEVQSIGARTKTSSSPAREKKSASKNEDKTEGDAKEKTPEEET